MTYPDLACIDPSTCEERQRSRELVCFGQDWLTAATALRALRLAMDRVGRGRRCRLTDLKVVRLIDVLPHRPTSLSLRTRFGRCFASIGGQIRIVRFS